ncbi:MAG: PdaC/SigV domain-containing protein [Stenotrophomonas sp.]
MKKYRQGAYAALLVLLVTAGCGKNNEAGRAEPAPATSAAEPAAAAATTQPDLRDVIETNPRYVVGISYPPAASKYPGLARELVAYAATAKEELVQAVDVLGNDKPTAPYELSLSFELAVDTPQVVAATADGSRYTGGAHGEPLVARFVWLPAREEMLTAAQMVPSSDGWKAIGSYVALQLREQAIARAEAEALSPEEQQAQVRNLSKMIDEGTSPKADNFAQFQPLMDATGHIAAVRFVFPPYQVGPYSDGTQSVDVPAKVLLPYVAPAYQELFAHP